MSAFQAMIPAPLEVRVCGAIKPARKAGFGQTMAVRHFVSSGIVVFRGEMVWLSLRENQVFSAIVTDQSRHQFKTIVAFISEDDPDGGPDNIDGVARQIAQRLRVKLQSIGLDIVRDGHPHAAFVVRRHEARSEVA